MKFILIPIFFISYSFSKTFNIYVDADFTFHNESADAIYRALKVAFDNSLKKHNFIIKKLDHRGNTRRSFNNLKLFQKDPDALILFGGLHSPPLIKNKMYINTNKILTLVPWAAGSPVTRNNKGDNWIFRLSIDDYQAGEFISQYAIEQGCKRPYLLLEKTTWGESNYTNMRRGLKTTNIKEVGHSFFNWNISKYLAREIINKSKKLKTDCLFFVGNTSDATTFFNFLNGPSPKVFSHWGILGAERSKIYNIVKKNNLNLKVIQTSFSFHNKKLNKYQNNVLKKILNYYPDINSSGDLQAMSGWIHTYDLATIILSILKKVDLNKPILDIRREIKYNLENVNLNHQGLIKIYKKAFSSDKNDLFSHEALRKSDYRMGFFNSKGNIIIE